MQSNTNSKPNALVNESSPYLLQHAYNPVNWQAYSEMAFLEAEANDKLVIISIGYSTCHWCHVMENESFEDTTVAQIMNEHFVNIKVDREERPDIDAIYMQAVQLMTGRGGWPLNVIVLPDKRCIYGGTYFPKAKWVEILKNIQSLWDGDRAQIYTYAENLLSGMKQTSLLLEFNSETTQIEEMLKNGIENDRSFHDLVNGGSNRAPKFPMPVNYNFRLNYSLLYKDEKLKNHVQKTLFLMAIGGIYDQVGGGFYRYSTDAYWKVPHFEKMLYDNAQLLQLYARANKHLPNPEFERVCDGIFSWLMEEMKAPQGGFYAAQDADSEGIEGKFYIFTKDELIEALGADFELASSIYEINAEGYWENNYYVLLRSELNPNTQINNADYYTKLNQINALLKSFRSKRIKPSTDTKIICSWNAMLVSALCEYYKWNKKENAKKEAEELIDFLLQNCMKGDEIYRTPELKIQATLEDYSLLCTACIDVASISEKASYYLIKAKEISEIIDKTFAKEENGFYAMTALKTNDILMPVYEIQDNVIASSNALHAYNKLRLAHIFAQHNWEEDVHIQLTKIMASFAKYPEAYSKWAELALLQTNGYAQLVISGKNAMEYIITERENSPILSDTFPLMEDSKIPLFSNRFIENKNSKYVCHGHQCDLPINL